MADTLKQVALNLLDDFQASEMWVQHQCDIVHSSHVLHEWVAAKRAEIERLASETTIPKNPVWTRVLDEYGVYWFTPGPLLTDEERLIMRANERSGG